MQNLQDIQEKIFFESKSILETLSRINSKEELLGKQDLFAEVTDRIAFLRILDKNREHFIVEEQADKFETDDQRNFSGNEIISPDSESFDESPLEDDLIEEEVMFTNELNEIENEEPLAETASVLETPVEFETEMVEEEMLAEIENEQNYEERVAQKEKEFHELEERRRMIVDFKKEDVIHPPKDEVF
ncbi:MAG: hypothetical protein ACXWB3_06905, partial [Kaistella sp.]